MAWNLARGETFLPYVSLKELKLKMAAETNAKARLRWLIAIHRKQGKSIDEIADACATKRTTVHGVLRRFQDRGQNAARAIKQAGRPPQLTVRQRGRLLEILDEGNPRTQSGLWTTKEVRERIRKLFGVTYAPQHVWRLLTTCGFSLLQPRPRHYKSPSDAVKNDFKKKRGALRVTTEKGGLSWALKMKHRTASSRA